MVNGGENIKNSDENYRMKYPLDVLNKRQFGYLGDIAHKYYNFPGKYDSPCFNEYPSVNGSALRTDTSYFIVMEDGQKRIMNVEDGSGNVNKKVLRKIAKYRDNMRYTFKCPVNSAIKTSKSLENCLTCLKLSETDIITPISKTARQFFEDKLFNEGKAEGFSEGRTEGFSEGRTEGHLEMAVKFVEKFGVDAVADASGFSRDEILKHSKK